MVIFGDILDFSGSIFLKVVTFLKVEEADCACLFLLYLESIITAGAPVCPYYLKPGVWLRNERVNVSRQFSYRKFDLEIY